VSGVSEHAVHNTDDILGFLTEGNKRRMQEPTAANRESSRSHAVLQIHVTGREGGGAEAPKAVPAKGKLHRGGYREAQKGAAVPSATVRVGKFSLIDLAGSERAVNTQNTGIRLIEGANINRSLLSLGNCIEALVIGKGAYVPYRDSKLTRLLKDSLGGNCKTVMISCISPAAASFEESEEEALLPPSPSPA
jgi:kinesin family protein 18/19